MKALLCSIEEDKKESKLKKKPLKKSSLSTKAKESKLAKSSVVAEIETKPEEAAPSAEIDTPAEPKAEEQPVENESIPTEEPKIDDAEVPKDEIIPSEEVPVEEPNEEAPIEGSIEPKEVVTSTIEVCEETIAKDMPETPCSLNEVNNETSTEKFEPPKSTTTTDFEWNFDSPAPPSSAERKEEFNTMTVATSRREARRDFSLDKESPSERRATSTGRAEGAYRRSRRDTKPASAMSYLQLLSSPVITYQEIYGGARFYRARAIHYLPSYTTVPTRPYCLSRSIF